VGRKIKIDPPTFFVSTGLILAFASRRFGSDCRSPISHPAQPAAHHLPGSVSDDGQAHRTKGMRRAFA
jgi:hypothetical protein